MTAPTDHRPTAGGWIEDEDTLASRLQAVRRRMGWGNVSEAARACGLPAENWRLWEQGRYPSRLTTIAMVIATKTGADYLWLVHGKNRGQVTAEYPHRRNPLAPRVISRGEVKHGDSRRAPSPRRRAVAVSA